MTTFNPTQHPRVASGEFTSKRATAPVGILSADAPSAHGTSGQGIAVPTDKELHNAAIEAHYRQGDGEISDEAARTIAADILLNPGVCARVTDAASYPLLRQVALGEGLDHSDLTTVEAVLDEIALMRHFDTAGTGSTSKKNLHMDMLATWALNGCNTPS